MQIFHWKMLLEQRTLFQQHFSVKYLHRKPINFFLLWLICDSKRNLKQLWIFITYTAQFGLTELCYNTQQPDFLERLPVNIMLTGTLSRKVGQSVFQHSGELGTSFSCTVNSWHIVQSVNISLMGSRFFFLINSDFRCLWKLLYVGSLNNTCLLIFWQRP